MHINRWIVAAVAIAVVTVTAPTLAAASQPLHAATASLVVHAGAARTGAATTSASAGAPFTAPGVGLGAMDSSTSSRDVTVTVVGKPSTPPTSLSTSPTAPGQPGGPVRHDPSEPGGGSGVLAFTGVDVVGVGIIGGLALAVGVLVLAGSRRRRIED